MKNYIRYIICSLSILCFSTSYAQELSWRDKRLLKLAVYNAVEDYEINGSLSDENSKEKFVRLFESANLQIYNDLLGVSTATTLSVFDYIKCVEEKLNYFNFRIRNINIGDFYEKDGRWFVDVTFDKEVESYNKNDIPLFSKAYYGTDYSMSVTYVCKGNNEVGIVVLNGEMKSDVAPLPEEFFAIERSKVNDKDGNEIPNPRDLEVLYNGNRLNFMKILESNYALLPGTIKKEKLSYPSDNDINVKYVSVNNSHGLFYLKYRPTHWRLKLRSDFTLGDYYNFDIEHKDDIVTKSSSNEFALELGYVFPSSKKLKVGLFFGAGIAMNKFELGFDSWDYSSLTNGSADVDGDKYTRHYSLKNFKQEYSTMDVMAPVYLDFEYRFSKWFSMYVDLGAKAYYNLESEVGTLYGEYSTYGVYSQYDNLLLDYQSGINGFTDNGVLGDGNIINKVLEPEEFTFDAFGSLGFRVGITKNLQLGCGATYQMGLTEYFTNAVNTIGMSNQQENVLVMYSTAQNKEIVRSMIDAASSVKRQTLKLNVGLTLKF